MEDHGQDCSLPANHRLREGNTGVDACSRREDSRYSADELNPPLLTERGCKRHVADGWPGIIDILAFPKIFLGTV